MIREERNGGRGQILEVRGGEEGVGILPSSPKEGGLFIQTGNLFLKNKFFLAGDLPFPFLSHFSFFSHFLFRAFAAPGTTTLDASPLWFAN